MDADANCGEKPCRSASGTGSRDEKRGDRFTEQALSGQLSVRLEINLFPPPIKRTPIMNSSTKVLYTGKTHTTGGRDGASRSSDGRLDVKLGSPGASATGTNPEQMLAAGWSACFIGAMGLAAKKLQVALPADTAVDAEIDLAMNDSGYFLQARLNVSLPGIDRETAQAITDTAHQTCPYSKATRGNIDVVIAIV
jgi:Ohr subfamily peroxiredoxin